MYVLGIDTSCDDTAVAIVENGEEIVTHRVSSQVEVHRRFGGVVPELASRSHLDAIVPTLEAVLEEADCEPDAVAVTNRPGLIGALLIGVAAAKAWAFAKSKPLVGVDHIAAHVYSPRLVAPRPAWPYLALIVSGGHTALFRAESAIDVQRLGTTTDDAAGEAYDKVSALLGLGYPGGPAIDRAAQNGDGTAEAFPRTLLAADSLDFSFSGVKTAVLYKVRGQDAQGRPLSPEEAAALSEQRVSDVAASFQEAVVDVLVEKTLRAARREGLERIAVGGGVAANSRLRERLTEAAAADGRQAFFPPRPLCTDNAAMIAGLGYHLLREPTAEHGLALEARPRR
ncbi:MAG: tRNA (adenosine(37)-N6)-threonylcarbamoyltransferase complex transferase subunit TsaD [Planctomycetota bacterium]